MYFIVIQKYINSDKTVENFNMNESNIRHNNLFKYNPSNARIMYNNTGELPWNRHIINSSIPYDIDIDLIFLSIINFLYLIIIIKNY